MVKIHWTVAEVLKTSCVGIIGTLADMLSLYLLYEFVFPNSDSHFVMALCVAIAFIVGVLVNLLLADCFVFNSKQQKKDLRTKKGVFIYFLVFFVGFWLTEGLMWIGVHIVGSEGLWYMLVKLLVSIIVFFWNYLARKVFVYHGA